MERETIRRGVFYTQNFYECIRLGCVAGVRYLFEPDHGRAVRIAAEHGHVSVLDVLAELGQDLHAGDNRALRWAAEKGHFSAVQFLVSRGGDVNGWQSTALIWAAGAGHMDVVQYLVEQSADINQEAIQYARANRQHAAAHFLEAARQAQK